MNTSELQEPFQILIKEEHLQMLINEESIDVKKEPEETNKNTTESDYFSLHEREIHELKAKLSDNEEYSKSNIDHRQMPIELFIKKARSDVGDIEEPSETTDLKQMKQETCHIINLSGSAAENTKNNLNYNFIEHYEEPVIDIIEDTDETSDRKNNLGKILRDHEIFAGVSSDEPGISEKGYINFHGTEELHCKAGYKCTTCFKKFQSENSLREHMMFHSIEKNYISGSNEVVQKFRKYCPRNLPVNSDVKTYTCNVCNDVIISQRSFYRHMKHHTDTTKRFVCNECTKRFYEKSNLARHLLLHSGIKVKNHKCEVCEKRFAYESDLNIHYVTHTGTKTHICDVCHKSFTQKASLRTHKVRHTGVKNYICHICSKSFIYKFILCKHMLTHANIKSNVCNICSKSFRTVAYLNKHVERHSGIRNYTCELCYKSFKQKIVLINHMVVHSNIKNFICTVCDMSFATQKYLDNHIVLHSNVKKYKCFVCCKSFHRKSYLDKHLKSHTRKRKTHTISGDSE